MATIPAERVDIEGGAYLIKWENMQSGDVGEAIRFAGAPDRTVQVFGTFDGATAAIEGSLDTPTSNFATLTDPQGNSLSFSTAKVETVMELVRFLRPAVSDGGAGTSLNVYILLGGTK